MAFYTRGDKALKDTAKTPALIAEFEAERDRLDDAFDSVAAAVTAATYGIAGAVDLYANLPAPGTLDENAIYIVRLDTGSPSGNGLYRVGSGAWVFLDALNEQDASEVSYDNTASGLVATDAQAAIDELDGRLDTAEPTIAASAAHATGDGSDHANVALGDTHRTGNGADHANVALGDTHRTGDGSDHANVALGDTHRTGDGSDHANVALGDTHRTGDGSDHANVALSDTHRTGNGADHANVALADTHRSATNNPHSVTAAQVAASNDWTTPPTGTSVGEMCFDTTAVKPYWWTGAGWVDATGGAHA